MKFLVLIFSILSTLAFAQKNDSKDPQSDLYLNAHTAASVVDTTGSFATTQTQSHSIPLDPACPACNLHGGIGLVDENGTEESSKAKAGDSDTSGTLGQ